MVECQCKSWVVSVKLRNVVGIPEDPARQGVVLQQVKLFQAPSVRRWLKVSAHHNFQQGDAAAALIFLKVGHCHVNQALAFLGRQGLPHVP